MSKVNEGMLQDLFAETVKGIEKRVKSEEACAADFNAAIALLKLNNITVDPENSETLKQLQNTLEEKRAKRKARVAGLTAEEESNIIQAKFGGE